MKRLPQILFMVLAAVLLVLPSTVMAAENLDWLKEINLQARANPSQFKARLATRFQIGDARIDAVFSNVESPADAYLIFRLGELAGKSPEYVFKRYRAHRGKGWGALAKSLGIKPGSREFHALKRDDFFAGNRKGKGKPGNGGNRRRGQRGRR